MKRRILFVTGTRADFGKLKSLMHAVEAEPDFECQVFVTGMHMLSRYGMTIEEVRREGFGEVYPFMNLFPGEPMEIVLGNTVAGLSRIIQENPVELIVVHGDRCEALAGAIVGALRNILVAHVEGGEVSGTVDELLRHAVTKLSHVHFVANKAAAERLVQLGERADCIHAIGSPEMDVALSDTLPTLDEVKAHYEIPFESYGIAVFHPVTTELTELPKQIGAFVDALLESSCNYVVVDPNNDAGCERIFEEYRRLAGNPRFRVFPSVRFEAFLTLMKHARFMVGNSSAGIREAPGFGVPSVNVGNRQKGRHANGLIVDVEATRDAILEGIRSTDTITRGKPVLHFGDGRSAEQFVAVLRSEGFWALPTQKQFIDWNPLLQPAGAAGP